MKERDREDSFDCYKCLSSFDQKNQRIFSGILSRYQRALGAIPGMGWHQYQLARLREDYGIYPRKRPSSEDPDSGFLSQVCFVQNDSGNAILTQFTETPIRIKPVHVI